MSVFHLTTSILDWLYVWFNFENIMNSPFKGILNTSVSLAKDIDAFFVGWIDSSVSSVIYPYFLKVYKHLTVKSIWGRNL